MDSLQSLLGNRVPSEPPEIRIIKSFVQDKFHEDVEVMVRERDIMIVVRNAGLAGALRMHTPQLQQLCETDKRITFRIG